MIRPSQRFIEAECDRFLAVSLPKYLTQPDASVAPTTMAEMGLEPGASAVTGRRSNQGLDAVANELQ